MNINYYMRLAIEEAKKAYLFDEVPIGAILVDNCSKSIISSAQNQIFRLNNPTKHAEMNVIDYGCDKKKSKYLFNTSIFITLEPCAMCATAISKAKIERIYFGAYDEKQGSLESIMHIYNNKNFYIPEIYGGIEEKECSQLLKKFFKTKRNKNVN